MFHMNFFRKSLFVLFFIVFSGVSVRAGTPVDPLLKKSDPRPAFVPREILVQAKRGIGHDEMKALHRRIGGAAMRRIDRAGIYRVRIGKGVAIEDVLARYRASGLVAQAERHAVRYPQAAVLPDDPYYPEQWAVDNVDARSAWSIRRTDCPVVVAVIDTGIDYTHPDLRDNIWTNEAEVNGAAGVDDDGNGYVDDRFGWDFAGNDADPMDYNGHGTHVAGIIGALGDNGIGVAGISWNVRLMPLKVSADDSTDMSGSDILEALEYARSQGAAVFNCSFGGPYDSTIEYEVIKSLQQSGGLVVCAAGNAGVDIDLTGNAVYPASYDLANIIAVAAYGEGGNLGSFSNFGQTSVDLTAPGVDILSTRPTALATAETKVTLPASGVVYAGEVMLFAGTTGPAGIGGCLYDCGFGYPEEIPEAVRGNIALVQRGSADGSVFYFSEKMANVQAKGGIAAIIYNNGPGSFSGTLGTAGEWIPAVCVSGEDGQALGLAESQTVRVLHYFTDDRSLYGQMSGTSMATPYVSGLIALMRARRPELGFAAIKSAVLDNVVPEESAAGKTVSGGRVNLYDALGEMLIPGDVNGDGRLAIDDLITTLQVLTGVPTATPVVYHPEKSDINSDRRLGIEEGIYILDRLAR